MLKSRPVVTMAGISRYLRGQDGRVVKAGALGDAHVKSWDRTWSNPGFEKAHRVGLALKLRPLVTVAGVSQILRGQDGRVVKASFSVRSSC